MAAGVNTAPPPLTAPSPDCSVDLTIERQPFAHLQHRVEAFDPARLPRLSPLAARLSGITVGEIDSPREFCWLQDRAQTGDLRSERCLPRRPDRRHRPDDARMRLAGVAECDRDDCAGRRTRAARGESRACRSRTRSDCPHAVRELVEGMYLDKEPPLPLQVCTQEGLPDAFFSACSLTPDEAVRIEARVAGQVQALRAMAAMFAQIH